MDTSQLGVTNQVDKPFDGDNLAGVLIPETEMVEALRNLSSSALIYNRNTGEVSSEIGIHKTLAITWNSFLGTLGATHPSDAMSHGGIGINPL